ncbi:MAG: M56 family metallopeptidase [Gemmatimonadetes bacterium]|nr:M56 family metallopeptidase [Gemmatimonadota bacterium]
MTDPGYAITLFDRLGRGVVDLLWLPSLEALILGVLVWALLLLNPGCPPRIRHFLWLLVLAKLIFSVVLPWPGPFEIPWAPVVHAAGPAPGGRYFLETYIYAGTGLAWIAIAGLGVIRVVSAVIMLTRRKRRAVPVTVLRVRASFDSCLAELGLKRKVALRVSDEFEGPALIAVGRPVVVIPSWCILELSDAELRQVLLHELAHYARRDHLTVVLVQFARIFFFFHPAVWYATRRIDIEAERACDAAVVRVSSHPERYASTLLKVAGGKVRTHWQAVLELARSASVVAIRIRDLLGSAVSQKQSALFSLLAVGFCTLIAVMPLFHSDLNAPVSLGGLVSPVSPIGPDGSHEAVGPVDLVGPARLAGSVDMPAAARTGGIIAGPEPRRIEPVPSRPEHGAVESGGLDSPAGLVERRTDSVARNDFPRIMVDGRPAPRRSTAAMMIRPNAGYSSGAFEPVGHQGISPAAPGPSVAALVPDRPRSAGNRLRQGRIEVQGVGQTGNALFDPATVSLSAGYFLTPTHQFGGVFSIHRPDDTEAFDDAGRSPGVSYTGNLLRARKLAGFGSTSLRRDVLEVQEEEQADRITRIGAFYRYNLTVPGGSFTPFFGCGTGLEIRPQNRHMAMVDAGVGMRYFWERHVAMVVQAAYRKELDVISRPLYPEMTLGFSAIF